MSLMKGNEIDDDRLLNEENMNEDIVDFRDRLEQIMKNERAMKLEEIRNRKFNNNQQVKRSILDNLQATDHISKKWFKAVLSNKNDKNQNFKSNKYNENKDYSKQKDMEVARQKQLLKESCQVSAVNSIQSKSRFQSPQPFVNNRLYINNNNIIDQNNPNSNFPKDWNTSTIYKSFNKKRELVNATIKGKGEISKEIKDINSKQLSVCKPTNINKKQKNENIKVVDRTIVENEKYKIKNTLRGKSMRVNFDPNIQDNSNEATEFYSLNSVIENVGVNNLNEIQKERITDSILNQKDKLIRGYSKNLEETLSYTGRSARRRNSIDLNNNLATEINEMIENNQKIFTNISLSSSSVSDKYNDLSSDEIISEVGDYLNTNHNNSNDNYKMKNNKGNKRKDTNEKIEYLNKNKKRSINFKSKSLEVGIIENIIAETKELENDKGDQYNLSVNEQFSKDQENIKNNIESIKTLNATQSKLKFSRNPSPRISQFHSLNLGEKNQVFNKVSRINSNTSMQEEIDRFWNENPPSRTPVSSLTKDSPNKQSMISKRRSTNNPTDIQSNHSINTINIELDDQNIDDIQQIVKEPTPQVTQCIKEEEPYYCNQIKETVIDHNQSLNKSWQDFKKNQDINENSYTINDNGKLVDINFKKSLKLNFKAEDVKDFKFKSIRKNKQDVN